MHLDVALLWELVGLYGGFVGAATREAPLRGLPPRDQDLEHLPVRELLALATLMRHATVEPIEQALELFLLVDCVGRLACRLAPARPAA